MRSKDIFTTVALLSLVIIAFGSEFYKKAKFNGWFHRKKKSQLTKESEFVTTNKDKIESRIDENSKKLKLFKMKIIVSLFFLGISVLSFFVIDNNMISIILCVLSAIFWGLCLLQYNSENDNKYVETVTNCLHDFDSNLRYLPDVGFEESEYYSCLFPEKCDSFHSEDMIINPKNQFYYSDIKVESEYEDDDGHSHYVTEFQGSLARMDIKNTNFMIFLGSTKKKIIFGDNGFTNLEFENDEFNKLFKACTDNELLAYKLLTPDIMEEFVKVKKNTYGDIDIRILHDKLYIRFLSGDTFDSMPFNKSIEKKKLLQSLAILEEVMKTMNKVKKLIEEKEIN